MWFLAFLQNARFVPRATLQPLTFLHLFGVWTRLPKLNKFKKDVEALRKEYIDDVDKFEEKVETLRCKEIKALLFDEYLRETNNEKAGVQSMTKFFTKV